jgi:sporulation protein YlmC with PRC-barrel domain
MYVLASQLKNLAIISLQTGETVTQVHTLIIEMEKLEIVAIACTPMKEYPDPILMVRDIRQIASDCLIIDSEDDIGSGADVIRLKEPIREAYSPIGAHVVSHMQRPIGKVEDFTINSESLKLQKLYIRQPIWRSWLGSSLIISREQILDVKPKLIVVKEATIESKSQLRKQVPEPRP